MIHQLPIEHFRGFYERRTVTFAVPSGNPASGLTVLVGPNNSGKTTVVEAIRLVSQDAVPIDVEHRHDGHRVRITVTDQNGRTRTLTNPDLGAITVVEGDPAAL